MSTLMLALVIAGAIPATLLPLVCWFRSGWRTRTARSLLILSIGLGWLYDQSLVNRAVGEYPGQRVLTYALVVYLMLSLWYLLIAMLSVPRTKPGE